jgi:hypothetical protein
MGLFDRHRTPDALDNAAKADTPDTPPNPPGAEAPVTGQPAAFGGNAVAPQQPEQTWPPQQSQLPAQPEQNAPPEQTPEAPPAAPNPGVQPPAAPEVQPPQPGNGDISQAA